MTKSRTPKLFPLLLNSAAFGENCLKSCHARMGSQQPGHRAGCWNSYLINSSD
jgi:hypothetical protein